MSVPIVKSEDSPAEKNLLRRDLLEEFMQKRPKTKDEWFRKISEQMPYQHNARTHSEEQIARIGESTVSV